MNKKLKKELIEWGIMLIVVAILLITGWYKDVAGFLQRGILETGLLKPSISDESRIANYDFQLVNIGGRSINFSEFENKTVFMNFWATWCPPCIAEMPDINDLYGKIGDRVAFVMICMDDNPQLAIDFVNRKGFDLPIYFLKTNLPATYPIGSIPTTYILSPEGKIVVEQHGLSKYDSDSFKEYLLSLGQPESLSEKD